MIRVIHHFMERNALSLKPEKGDLPLRAGKSPLYTYTYTVEDNLNEFNFIWVCRLERVCEDWEGL